MALTCQYCNKPAKLVLGGVIYPRRPDLWKKNFWNCGDCKAWVGCYPNSRTPLGVLANEELRKLKKEVHDAFDPIWRNGRMSRSQAYKWLSGALNIPAAETHVGMFSPDRCREALEVVRNSEFAQ